LNKKAIIPDSKLSREVVADNLEHLEEYGVENLRQRLGQVQAQADRLGEAASKRKEGAKSNVLLKSGTPKQPRKSRTIWGANSDGNVSKPDSDSKTHQKELALLLKATRK